MSKCSVVVLVKHLPSGKFGKNAHASAAQILIKTAGRKRLPLKRLPRYSHRHNAGVYKSQGSKEEEGDRRKETGTVLVETSEENFSASCPEANP